MVKIVRPDDIEEGSLARYGIYGENGVGKTTFLTTIPDEERLLVISEEGQNIKPLKGYRHIKIAPVSQWKDVEDLHKFLIDMAKSKPELAPTAVAFDGWPIRLIINKATGAHLGRGEEREWLSNPPDQRPSNWGDWDKVAGLSNYGILCFLRLPVHMIFLFDEEAPRLDKGEITRKGGPMLPTQALAGARRYLEVIGRMFVDVQSSVADDFIPDTAEEVRRLLIGKHEFFFSKGPTHALGYTITNPSWDKLLPALTARPLRINGHANKEES